MKTSSSLLCFAWASDLWLQLTRFARERYAKTHNFYANVMTKFTRKLIKLFLYFLFFFLQNAQSSVSIFVHFLTLHFFPPFAPFLVSPSVVRTFPRNEMIKRVSERNNIKHGEESETVAAVDIIQYSIRKLLLQISSRKVSVRVQHITISSVWNVKTLQVCSFIHYDCRLHRHRVKVSCGEQVEFDVRKLSLMSHNRDMSTIKKRHSVCVWREQVTRSRKFILLTSSRTRMRD